MSPLPRDQHDPQSDDEAWDLPGFIHRPGRDHLAPRRGDRRSMWHLELRRPDETYASWLARIRFLRSVQRVYPIRVRAFPPGPSPRGRIEPLPDYRTATESDTSSGVTARRAHPSLRDEHWTRRLEPRRRVARGDGAVQGTPSYGSLTVNVSGAEGSALGLGSGSSSTVGGVSGGDSGLTAGRLERNSRQFDWLKQEREKMGRESGSRAASTRKDAILGVIAAVDKR